jgi:iron complex transport system ATP-binding protein
VLHDLNHAAAYSDHIVMLKQGRLIAEGPPRAVMSPAAIREVFGIEVCVIPHPIGGTPVCLPTCLCGATSAANCPVRPGAPAPMAAD